MRRLAEFIGRFTTFVLSSCTLPQSLHRASRIKLGARARGRIVGSIGPALAAALIVTGTSWDADAKPRHRGKRFRDGGYLYLMPGANHFPIGDDEREESLDPGYQWGMGVGVLLRPRRRLRIGLGGQFEHAFVGVEGCDLGDCGAQPHLLRILPEIRVGAAVSNLFLYVRGAVGLDLLVISNEGTSQDVDPGIGLGVHAGLQGLVTRRFALGGEFGGSFALLGEDAAGEWYGVHLLDFRVLAGWYF